MEAIPESSTAGWSLAQVLERLRQHEQVEGLLLIGSLATQTLTQASDYDLVIVLRQAAPPWYVGVTTIEQRFTDLIFVAASAVEQLSRLQEPISADHELAPVLRWLKHGQLRFDRHGLLGQVQQRLAHEELRLPVAGRAGYGAWFAMNYNLAQARRMLQASDRLYHTTVQLRMAVYGHLDLWLGYFTVRQLDWPGDKAAVSYLQQHDPEFLERFQQFIAENDPQRKLALYEQAVALACAPAGGLWPAQATVMNQPDMLATWQALLQGA